MKILNPPLALILPLGLLMVLTLGGCHPEVRHDRPSSVRVHGHQWHPHDYYYYPHVGVYFHISSGHYYYHDQRRWHRVIHLPKHIYLHGSGRVKLRVSEDRPWRRHIEHRRSHQAEPRRNLDKKRWKETHRREHERNGRLHREYLRRRD